MGVGVGMALDGKYGVSTRPLRQCKKLVDEPFSTRASNSFCAYVHLSKPIRSIAKKAADLQRT